MKQILQDLAGGQTKAVDVPAPIVRPGCVRIATGVSLVSAGTERMLVDFARASLASKARQQPQRVRAVVEKVRTDGLPETLEAVRARLERPMALGYCNVGRVIETGAGVTRFHVGDRVVSNGNHAEIVVVPEMLCARVPDSVADDSAVFTVLGAVALQGVRLAEPTLGEAVAVTGVGLIGLIAVQILRANGCRVLAIDGDGDRLALARQFGAETVDLVRGENPVEKAGVFSRGIGVDAVLLTATAKSSEPISQAARMCRKRGRIVLVGQTGLELDRADFYEKEISFRVSCSYGPGRYDPEYEKKGHDYPVGFVRWTEQRNFETVVDLMAAGAIDPGPLISHRFAISDASKAYDLITSAESSLGVLIDFPRDQRTSGDGTRIDLGGPAATPGGRGVVAFIGAGNYGARVLICAFARAGADLDTLVSVRGVSAAHYGRKFGFRHAASDAEAAIAGAETDTVCIATRHDSHARLTRAALAAGKHVFVEKPLCLSLDELDEIAAAVGLSQVEGASPILMVGFNRRFAPLVKRAKGLIDAVAEPKTLVLTVNAGGIVNDHWVQDPDVGGGRIVGEACHFIDLLRHLVGQSIVTWDAAGVARPGGPSRTDNVSLRLRFADGSLGVLNYVALGHRSYPKERLEVFTAGRVLVLDDFRRLTGYGWPGFSRVRSWRRDKGQAACAGAFMAAVRGGGPPPIPLAEIIEVSRVAIEAAERVG